jgi:hypothetical protein
LSYSSRPSRLLITHSTAERPNAAQVTAVLSDVNCTANEKTGPPPASPRHPPSTRVERGPEGARPSLSPSPTRHLGDATQRSGSAGVVRLYPSRMHREDAFSQARPLADMSPKMSPAGGADGLASPRPVAAITHRGVSEPICVQLRPEPVAQRPETGDRRTRWARK